jgi:tetratricopeptide (TPR) repeat protein
VHEPTIRALEALMKGKDEPVLAAAVLEPIYESAGEWDRVIAVYEVMQANSDDPVRTVELLSRIAEIEERRLSHQNAAFDVYGRALRVDPNNQDVLAHLERLAIETGHWAKLSALLASEIEKVDEPRRAIDLLLRLARVYEEETGQLEEAIATYRRAITADPDSKQALVALDRLFGRAQAVDELAEIVRREIRIAPERRGSRRAHLPAGADLRAGDRRHAEGGRGLPRHPERRSRRTPRRARPWSGCSSGGTMQDRDRRRARAAATRPARSGRSCTGSTRCSWLA